MSFGANAALRMVSRKQIASSGALYMVTSEDRSDRSLIEAGMLCERLWLILSKHGLSVQPLGAFPVFNDLALDERAMLADSHRQRILRVREEVFESFHCCGSEVPVLLFRAGYAAKQSPRNLFRRTMIEVAPELLPERSKEKFDYDTAFSRNIGIVRRGEQELLKQTKVAIPGLGGVGGIHLATLARMGVGGFHLADFDRFDLANFNRQFGAFVSTLGESKTEVMSKIVRDINPEISLGVWKEGISEDNVEEFLRGTQLVIDSLDAYEIDVRRLVFMKARLMGIPVITAGPIGLSCAMLVFMPDSMSFDDYFCIEDGMSQQEKFTRFILGLIPHLRPFKYLITDEINSAERRGPSSAAAVTLCSGFAAVEALKVLLNKGEVRATPYCHYYDPYLMRFKCGYLRWGNRGPLQKMKYEIVKRKVSR
jgi:molybdopterin/thiamine biosynthesis adenylyltransferase